MPFRITAVIIALNEARNIARCVKSLREVADEILVLDSGSTDNTVALAQTAGATVLQVQWQGFGPTKNLGNDRAQHDWILTLDADEELTPELRREIVDLKAGPEPAATRIFCINRLSNYLGRWMRHSGWQPDWRVFLFHRSNGRWNAEAVHEQLVYVQPVSETRLKGALLHYTLPTLADHLNTINRYSSLHAERYMAAGKRFRWWHLWLAPAWKFIAQYLLRLGFLDGREGFWLAWFSALDRQIRALKHRELEQARKRKA
jgi:glycosyltransferase involved in cell wall biosynthesis